jgi:hypothetical protein
MNNYRPLLAAVLPRPVMRCGASAGNKKCAALHTPAGRLRWQTTEPPNAGLAGTSAGDATAT